MCGRKNKVLIGVIVVLMLTIVLLTLTLKPKKNLNIDNLNSSHNNQFAFYIQNADKTGYEKSSDNAFPEGYKLNINESKCVDNNGSQVSPASVLSTTDNKVTVTSSQTVYCTLYFDVTYKNLKKICGNNNLSTCIANNKSQLSDIDNLSDLLQGDLYRYQGSDVNNNYVCFSETDCTNLEKIFRIIGISDIGELKIIEQSQRFILYGQPEIYYYFGYAQDFLYDWAGSYLTNNIAKYFKRKMWDGMVGDWTNYKTANEVYEQEMNFSERNKVERTTQILLLSDYLFSHKSETACQLNSMGGTCPKSWISNLLGSDESLILANYYSGDQFIITDDGNLSFYNTETSNIYPGIYRVGYTNEYVYIESGTGTKEDPYILKQGEQPEQPEKQLLKDAISSSIAERNKCYMNNFNFIVCGTKEEVINNYVCVDNSDTCTEENVFRILSVVKGFEGWTDTGEYGRISEGAVKVVRNKSIGDYNLYDEIQVMAMNPVNLSEWINNNIDSKLLINGRWESDSSPLYSTTHFSRTPSPRLDYSEFNNQGTQFADFSSDGYLSSYGILQLAEYYQASSKTNCFEGDCSSWLISNTEPCIWSTTRVNMPNYGAPLAFAFKYGIFGTARPWIDNCGVKPALYLSPNVYVTSGDGSLENPYHISI